jgi:hypothetical protein
MYTIAFSVSKRRPGCILLQVAFGADLSPRFHTMFPSETWLVAPTDDMALYPVTEEQLVKLSDMAKQAVAR